jgi:beta-glucosidase/6-phospho-beta-glucosidase/beta-galactosidase
MLLFANSGMSLALSILLPLFVQADLSKATGSGTTLTLDGQRLPDDFIHGCGTSAYQIEGAWDADGKGVSIWDKFAHEKGKDHVLDDDTGDVAMDFYHTYEKDLPLFKQALGINNYDFTLSWTRLLPDGKGTTINQKGLQFYKDMIKKVHENGMSASCTLYHWDLPQALQDQYQGWTSPRVIDDFKNYATVVMEALGADCDRWISMNEPRTFCTEGYNTEVESAPAQKGTIDIMYKCMHNALLSHAHSYQVFQRLKRGGKVRGTFGIKTDGGNALPLDRSSKADQAAALRSNTFVSCLLLANRGGGGGGYDAEPD